MCRYLRSAVLLATVLLISGTARAGPIDITAGMPGALWPSLASASILTFENLPVGSLPFYQFNGGTLSGAGAIENTSLVGEYAQPAGDASNYLTVSYPAASGSVVLAFSSPQNYFGLYWGSIDPYNAITFLDENQSIATFSGSDVASLTGLTANGDQQSPASNRYINFDFGAGSFDEVVLSTNGFGFEIDNIAFHDPPAPIFEPGTLLLLGASLSGFVFVRRRSLRKDT
jgi:hypothetical protein